MLLKPTTKILDMNDLVIMKNEVPVVSTFDLFERMGYKEHRNLKETIDKNIDDFNEFGVMRFETVKPQGKKGGRPVKVYLLDENQFTFLAMMMRNTPEVVKLKVKIAKEFIRMKNTLANIAVQQSDVDWQTIRSDGKAIYHQKSSAVKDFVEYAKSQGSTSAERYYSNLATMENKALFFIERKYKNLREILNIKQLMQIATADQIVEKALIDGMSSELHYKEIYKLAKARVIAFSEVIGKSQLLELEVKHEN